MNTGAQLRAEPSIVDLTHEERVEFVADSASGSFQPKPIDDSWRRCLRDFHVDPQSSSVPHLLTERKLRISREPLGSFLLQAQEEIDRLYAIVRAQSFIVLLCNSDGVAIHHRGDASKGPGVQPVRPGCNARYSRRTNPIGRSRRPRTGKRRA
jgi:transcriptional regulator of acetoin/glycerol metabolism